MKPQPNTQQTIARLIIRHLRHCYLERDIEALASAGLGSGEDIRLLDDLDYWIDDRPKHPAVTARLEISWMKIKDAIESAARQKDIPASRSGVYGNTVAEIIELALLAINKSDYDLLNHIGLTEKNTGFLSNFTITALLYLEACPFSINVRINPHRVAQVDRRRERLQQATADCITLIRCGATYPMLFEITGMSTQEFAAARKVVGMDGNGKVISRTYDEEVKINDLLNQVCRDRTPQLSDYVKICELTYHTIDISKVYAEFKIRYSSQQSNKQF